VDGTIIGTSKVVRDISVSKHFETRLMESEARFRTLYEKAPMVTCSPKMPLLLS
jgi:hypothetical protein